MLTKQFIRIGAAMLAALIFLYACDSPEPAGPQDNPEPHPPVPEKVEVVSVSMSETSITLEEGDSHTLVATVLPSNADDPSVSWTSDDASVATVKDGVVTAVSVGSTKVTAKAGEKSAVCKVTVNDKIYKVESIVISESALSIDVSGTFSLSASVFPENATDPSVCWSVDKSDIIEYSSDGASFSATAVKAGDVVVSVVSNSDNSIKASCRVSVTDPPVPVASISLDMNELSLETGSSFMLSASVLPDDASDPSVVWTVDNAGVVEIVADGSAAEIKALAAGDAVVRVSSVSAPDVFACCNVNVKPVPVRSILLDRESATIEKGVTIEINASVFPDNAADPSIVWTVDNPEVLSLQADGGKVSVTSLSAGDALVKASSVSNSEVYACCSISVKSVPVQSIILDKELGTIEVGSTIALHVSVFPEDAAIPLLVWSVGDPSSVSIVSEGDNALVTGLSIGQSEVMVSLESDPSISAYCVIKVKRSTQDVPVDGEGVSYPEDDFGKFE